MIKRLIAVFLVLILSAATLAGCGAKIDPNDPNQGLWKATTAEMFGISMEVTDMFGKGFTIELKDKGKCALNVDGKKANGTWTLDGSAFTVKGGGVNCQGTLANGKIVLDDVMGMGMALTFEKEGGYQGATNDVPADVGHYVIDSIVQDGQTYDSNDLASMGVEYYLRLNADGSAEISTDSLIKGTWKPGQIEYVEDGDDVKSDYTLEGDLLTIELGGGNVTLTFKRSSESTEQSASGEKLNENLAWWDGAWYGWLNVLEGHGAFSGLESEDGDCYAFVDMRSDGTGTLYMWDDNVEMGTLEIFVDLNEGSGPMGELKAVSGTLFSLEVTDGDFFCDPASEDYENLFYIYDDVRTSNEDYARYEIYLRPWGTVWDDMPSYMQPTYYSDWYIGRGYKDYEIMLEALKDTYIDGDAIYIYEGLPARAYAASDGTSGDTGKTSQDEASAPTQAPAPASSGSAGITTNALINETWDWMDTFEWDDRKTITYDEIAKRLGSEGESIDSDTNADKGAVHYRWKDPNGGVMRIEFRPNADGVYCFAQGNTSGT